MRYKLKEVSDIGSSKRIFARDYESAGVPFYRGKEILQKINKKHISNKLFISEDKFNDIKQKYSVPKENDILITAVGTIGGIYLVKKSDLPFYFKDGNLIRVFNIKSNLVNPQYLYYLLASVEGQNKINSIKIGSTQSALTIDDIRNIEFDFPNIETQKNICNRLSPIEKKISLNNQINDNLLELANVIFTKQINKDTTKLSNIATIQNGYAFKSKEYVAQKQLLILRTKNIGSNHLFNKFDVVYIDQDNFNEYKKFAFKKFDTVLVMVGASIGKTGFITSNVLPSLQNQNMWRFRVKNSRMPGLLLYEYVNYINKRVKGSASGSARSFYRKELFNDFEVPIIDNNIFTVFERIQLQINNIQVENNVLSKLRQELLNKYF